ncbi:unnamed protein product, partial [Dicrocoelium dendriticum]
MLLWSVHVLQLIFDVIVPVDFETCKYRTYPWATHFCARSQRFETPTNNTVQPC